MIKLSCNKNGKPIEDIFINNHNCDYRATCAGCNYLVEEDECEYIEYICGYEHDIEHIIDADGFPDPEINTPSDSIWIETSVKRIYHPCDYGDFMEECEYEGECPFKEEV